MQLVENISYSFKLNVKNQYVWLCRASWQSIKHEKGTCNTLDNSCTFDVCFAPLKIYIQIALGKKYGIT